MRKLPKNQTSAKTRIAQVSEPIGGSAPAAMARPGWAKMPTTVRIAVAMPTLTSHFFALPVALI